MKKYVAYYRVSTDRQGQSGLGLEAQEQAVEQYIQNCCLPLNMKQDQHSSLTTKLDQRVHLVAKFTEIESGKKNNRHQLNKAIALCGREKATLIIAKLDRLARNVHFVSGLMESRIDFVAVDNPHANKLMIHMLAAFAEHEREMISQRTKAALAAAKMRGVKLGVNGKILAERNKRHADIFAEMMKPIIDTIKNQGHKSVRDILSQLNKSGIVTSQGNGWHVCSTSRLLQRIERLWPKISDIKSPRYLKNKKFKII